MRRNRYVYLINLLQNGIAIGTVAARSSRVKALEYVVALLQEERKPGYSYEVVRMSI